MESEEADSAVTFRGKEWAHLSGLCCLLGIPSFLGPLVAYLITRESPSVRLHARRALNFHLSVLCCQLAVVAVATVLLLATEADPEQDWTRYVVCVGVALWAFAAVASARAAFKTYHGQSWSYPLAIRFVGDGD